MAPMWRLDRESNTRPFRRKASTLPLRHHAHLFICHVSFVLRKAICSFPGTLDHGKILIVGVIGKFEYRQYVRHVWHSTRIQFTCDRDYELRGPEDATCVHNRWSPPITTRCVPKQHPELPPALVFRGKRR